MITKTEGYIKYKHVKENIRKLSAGLSNGSSNATFKQDEVLEKDRK